MLGGRKMMDLSYLKEKFRTNSTVEQEKKQQGFQSNDGS
jgi:hypothetical protein